MNVLQASHSQSMIDRWVEFILNNGIVGFFDAPVTLASGQTSHWYVNWRKVAQDVYLIDQATDLLLDSLQQFGLAPDLLYGVPEGATKLALLSQYKWARQSETYGLGSHNFSMGRGKPKAHGNPADRAYLGLPQGNIIVLEDVTTTGGSLIRTIEQLQKLEGAKPIAAISLTNRQTSGPLVQEKLAATNVPFLAMCTAEDLLPRAIEQFKPTSSIISALRQECPFLNEKSEN